MARALVVEQIVHAGFTITSIVFNRWYADMCRKGVQVD